jgi:hypothetical protein
MSPSVEWSLLWGTVRHPEHNRLWVQAACVMQQKGPYGPAEKGAPLQ